MAHGLPPSLRAHIKIVDAPFAPVRFSRHPFRSYPQEFSTRRKKTMSGQERRISPRKECVVPVRFRIIKNGTKPSAASVRSAESVRSSLTHAHVVAQDGETVNLSERGIYFISGEKVKVGEELEIYFTLPSEVTGRGSEKVRCHARIVHAEPLDQEGLTGAGAVVQRFESVSAPRTWEN
jgi:hypothetical protein